MSKHAAAEATAGGWLTSSMDSSVGTSPVLPPGAGDDDQTDGPWHQHFYNPTRDFLMTIEQPKGRYARFKHALATREAAQRGRRSFLRSLLAISGIPVAGSGSWLGLSNSVVVRDGWVLSRDD